MSCFAQSPRFYLFRSSITLGQNMGKQMRRQIPDRGTCQIKRTAATQVQLHHAEPYQTRARDWQHEQLTALLALLLLPLLHIKRIHIDLCRNQSA